MHSSVLHITSGDITTNYLRSLKFQGKFITWREMLCEGKTSIDVGSESFWKTRFEFLKSSYKVTKKTFIDFTLKEYRTLCQEKNQKEIVLWFDSDLFCQINMIAIISWIKRFRKGEKVTMVYSHMIDDGSTQNLAYFNDLTQDQIRRHYKNRMTLSQDDIEYADYVWQLYCSNNPLRLETVHKFNPSSPFINLTDALSLHLKRFPSTENGLNVVENFIIHTAEETKPISKHKFTERLLENQRDFSLGYGDAQYTQKIDLLKSFFTSLHPVKLSRKGKKVLDNQLNFYRELRNEYSYLGGVKKYSYLYNNSNDKLMKITS